jgi:hypothetical protein
VDEAMDLRFRVDEQLLVIPAIIVESIDSPSTGRPLRRLSSEITVPAVEARSIATILQAPSLVDEDGAQWSGRIEVESYRDVQGLHNLRIGWEEQEQVDADAVEFEGMLLRPQHYEENTTDGGLAISFRARLTSAETQTLRGLQQPRPGVDLYFSVVRHGVSEQPRRMRLGRVLWQKLEDGDVEHQITLVEDVYDTAPRAGFRALAGEPQVSHLLDAVEQLAGERDALIDALKNGGVLDDDAIERVRQAGLATRGMRRYQFYEVDDISEWD